MASQRAASCLIALLLIASLTGCFGAEESASKTSNEMYPSIWDRHSLDWNVSHTHSFLLDSGPHHALDVQETTIQVDTTGVWEGGPNSADVHLSYWLPSNTEDGEKVPIIAVVEAAIAVGVFGSQHRHLAEADKSRGDLFPRRHLRITERQEQQETEDDDQLERHHGFQRTIDLATKQQRDQCPEENRVGQPFHEPEVVRSGDLAPFDQCRHWRGRVGGQVRIHAPEVEQHVGNHPETGAGHHSELPGEDRFAGVQRVAADLDVVDHPVSYTHLTQQTSDLV